MGLKEYSEAVVAFRLGDVKLAEKKMAEALGTKTLPDGALSALVAPGPAIDDAVLRQIQITERKRAQKV
jgi:hypothetical protein